MITTGECPAPAADPSGGCAAPLDLLPIGVATLDADGRVTLVNRTLAEVLGFRLPLGAQDLAGLVHQDDLATLRPRPAQDVHWCRPRLRFADGTYRPCAVAVTARWDGDRLGQAYACLTLAGERGSADRLRGLLNASPDGFALFEAVRDGAGHLVGLVLGLINEAGMGASPVQPDAVCGLDIRQIVPGEAGRDLYARLAAALGEARGSTRYTLDMGYGARLYDSHTVRLDDDTLAATWRDITEAEEGERLLERVYEETAEMRATLQTALDATSDGFAVYRLEWDENHELTALCVVHANAAGALSLGYEPIDMIDLSLHDLFPGVVASGLWARILEAARTKAPQHHRVHNFDDEGQWVDSWDNSIAPVGEERMAIYWRNVSAEESALRQLARHRDEAMHSATHDALTGLPNRLLLREHLQAALHTCPPDQRIGIVFVDLDGFKAINDTYGHAAGDAVLCATAERLSGMVRHGDLAARLAGDEFVLVLTQLTPGWRSDEFFARALALLAEPLPFEGVELHPSASLGVVLADPCSGPVDVDSLIKDADGQMYLAKAARKAAAR